MENTPLARLIQRKENVSRAAAAARQIFLSSSIGSQVLTDSVCKGIKSLSGSETHLLSSEGRVESYPVQIELTGQEIFDDSGGDYELEASQVSISDTHIVPGDPIFVLWENSIWYAATCIGIKQQKVQYQWLDPGNYKKTGTTLLSKIRRRIVGSFEIPAGALIYVKWSEDNNWYPARFQSKRANIVQFEWNGEYHGEWEATGTVESSHVRIMIDEAQAIRLDPMLLPSEDAVRRFTKDTSTAIRQESQAASTRWFLEKEENNDNVVLRLLELTSPNADKLLNEKAFNSKSTWEQTDITGPDSKTHLCFKRIPDTTEKRYAMKVLLCNVEPVCPKMMEVGTVLEKQHYAMVLISGLPPKTIQKFCVKRCVTGFQNILSIQQQQKYYLVQIIMKLCGIWNSRSGDSYLNSGEASDMFGQTIPSLQATVDIFIRQPVDLQMAAPRLGVLLALICAIDKEKIIECQPLNQVMATAAVYVVQCCREQMLMILSKLKKWLDQITTRFVSGGLVLADDRIKWLHPTWNIDLDTANSLGEIASCWDKFSAGKIISPSKIIALLQHCLENRTVSSQLNNDDREYCSSQLILIQKLRSCAEELGKYFSKCTFPEQYQYSQTCSLKEQILACSLPVLIERAVLKCISKSNEHIRLREAISDLFGNKNNLGHMQVVYAEVFYIEINGEISAKLVVTASNIHKWFPYLDTPEFNMCLEAEQSTHRFLVSDKILCLHMGDTHEMGLIPREKNLNKMQNIGNVNKSCLRHLHNVIKGIEKFSSKYSARKDLDSWLCDDDSGVRITISPLQNLVVYACMRNKIKRRTSNTAFDTELNFTIQVNKEMLWQTLDTFQDSFCSEHSKFFHRPKSLWSLSVSGSGNVHQLDKTQAALDIFSNFSGLNINNRLTTPNKKTKGQATSKYFSQRDILLHSYGELHSHLNEDALESIYKEIQAFNTNDPEVQGDKTHADQFEVDDDMQGDAHDPSDSLEPHVLFQDSGKVSDITMLLNSPDTLLKDGVMPLNTPDTRLKDSPDAVKFSTRKRTEPSAASRKLFTPPSQTVSFRLETTMNRDEYYQACKASGVLRRVQIETIKLRLDISEQHELDCQCLLVEAVLPNPNPNILMPLIVLIAQIPSAEGRTSLFSLCNCLQCLTSGSQTQTKTVAFFNSIKVLHLRSLCQCLDAMQYVLKQCIEFLQYPVNPFCGLAGDSEEDFKIENSFCTVYKKGELFENQLVEPNLKIVEIPNTSPKMKRVLSVLVQAKGSHEISHALVYVSTIQKMRLKELCKRKNLSETQVKCIDCGSRYITFKGKACIHTIAAYDFLYPPSQSARSDSKVCSESEEIDHGLSSGSDDQAASDQDESDFIDLKSIKTDNYLNKKQTSSSNSSLDTEKEYFDPELADFQTGYVFTSTLSSIQKARAQFDITFGYSPEMTACLQKQKHWTLLHYLTDDKTMFDLCSDDKFEGEFLPSDTCVYCSHKRCKELELEAIRTSPATVYLSNCQICNVPAKYWYCSNCEKTNRYDGRHDGIWFYSAKIAFSLVLVSRQLEGFVRGTIPKFSSFVRIHENLVKTAMFNAPVTFPSEKTWRTTCFSAWSTFPDLRFPCSICLLAAIGSKPADLTGDTLTNYKLSAPPHVWDNACIIQDAIADFVECRERNDLGAGTEQAFPVEQESSILDRCPIPTGGFTALCNGKHAYKNANNATQEQRSNATALREMFKSLGKEICEVLHSSEADSLFSAFKIKHLEKMKQLLRAAWHAKQKETETEHPLTLLLNVLNDQLFPVRWSYIEKARYWNVCGILCQQIGAQASVFTLIKDWVVPQILNFCSCMSDTYNKLQTIPVSESMLVKREDMLLQELQQLRKLRHELINSLAPNSESIPADPNIYQLVCFTSAEVDDFLSSNRDVNLAIVSVLKYFAYCVCEISSRHKILIDGCGNTGVFNLSTDTQRYRPVMPLRSYLRHENIGVGGSEISEAETEGFASYNPVKYNCALYFSRKAGQIRKVPYTGFVIGDRQDGDCTKKSYKEDAALGQSKSTAMLSAFQCGFHCTVVGYSIIFKGEGRKDSYYPIVAYKYTAPAVFIYDNACGTSSFCSSRYLSFFGRTTFMLDDFHGRKHNCSPSFRFGPEKDQIYPGLNTSAAEQRNSRLAHLKNSVNRMSLIHANFILQLVFFCWNIEELAKAI